MTDHLITPPPELAAHWVAEIYGDPVIPLHPITLRLVERAAQWGADQELEACLGEVSFLNSRALADRIRENRRPQKPSLKEQALMALEDGDTTGGGALLTPVEVSILRRALEALPDD